MLEQTSLDDRRFDFSKVSVEWIGLLGFVVFLAVSKYDPTSFLERGTELIDAFSWFWRYRFAGFLTFFDLLLFALLGLLCVRTSLLGYVRKSVFDRQIALILALCAGSAILGQFNGSEADSISGVLFAIRNYYYLSAAYVIASRLAWTETRYKNLAALLVAMAVLVFLLGLWETARTPEQYRLSKYGHLSSTRDATDGVLYIYAQLLAFALYLERAVRGKIRQVLLVLGISYALYWAFTSSSKTLIALYPLALLYFAWHYRLYRRTWFLPVVIVSGTLAIIALLAFTNLATIIRDPSSALYVYSTFANPDDPSIATRVNQLVNFLPNLYFRGAFIQGIGLGHRWHEFIPQFPEDTGAYPSSELGTGWHLGVHVPLLRIFLDFGLLGGIILLLCIWRILARANAALRDGILSPLTRACVQAAIMVIFFQVVVNNLFAPKTNLLIGVLIGATSGLLDQRLTRNGKQTGGSPLFHGENVSPILAAHLADD